MSESIPVTIQILDKEYRIACPENEKEALQTSAKLLHGRMREVRDSGKAIGADRIAVMAALNLTHELMHHSNTQGASRHDFSERVQALQQRIDIALNDDS